MDTYLKAQGGEQIVKSSLELPLKPEYVRGLEKARWPGRCQTVQDPTDSHSTWYLDGAHTVESLTACADWFTAPDLGLKE